MSARNNSAKEMGSPTKITRTMLTSMTKPMASGTPMSSDLDLLVRRQDRAGSPGTEALQELGDALKEEHEGRQRNDAAHGPDDGRPGARARALVDPDGLDEIIDRDEEQHRHGRQEEQER